MSFESAGNYLIKAASKYRLAPQAKASLTCERARQILRTQFPQSTANPTKAEGESLTLEAVNASQSSQLFMLTHEILEAFADDPELRHIRNIKIIRSHQQL